MKVCVVGSGGREHALATVLGRHHEVVVTPGNPGIPGSVDAPATAIDADLYVIGPEAPLVAGLADELRAAGRLVFGPGADGARLEGSKAWMKQVLVDAGVPTARHGTFTTAEPAYAFLDTLDGLYVVKTDGLAAGKGVVVTTDPAEARAAVDEYLSGAAFGDAGRTLVIEEGLTGPELSVLAVCDGTRAVALAPAQDFKRVGDGDAGPNTGGMGAYSPLDWAPADIVETVVSRVVQPTVDALRHRGTPFVGVVYAGLALTSRGLRVIEFNARFGDPETQVVLARLQNPLGHVLRRAAEGTLADLEPLRWHEGAAVTVVVAAKGYPGTPTTGTMIKGLDDADAVEGAYVLHAGTKAAAYQTIASNGGRVLSVVGVGADLAQARERAYSAVAKVGLQGGHHRTDIALAAERGEVRIP
jgi:phosphoribosylamine--glycine ligase